jgi:hypothetical protein
MDLLPDIVVTVAGAAGAAGAAPQDFLEEVVVGVDFLEVVD